MQTIRHILFPVDFSDRSMAAQPLVAAWGRRFKAKVTLLHTVQIPISAYGGPDVFPVIVDVPAMEAAAMKRLERCDIPGAEKVVKTGDPSYEIVQYAETNPVDLIMFPTHGSGTF